MTRCASCVGDRNCIAGDGPEECDLLFVGEAPGLNEDRKKQVFIGKTGDELNRGYLPICNLRRPNVRVTNAIKCYPPGTGKLNMQRQKDVDLLMTCAGHHLHPEIERMRPRLIIPMGAFACRAIDPDINLELQHGSPVETIRGTAFPMYHPAGGIHEPKKMLQIRTDWTRLNKYLKGRLHLPVDTYRGEEQYEVITSPRTVRDSLLGYRSMPIACDTESTRKKQPFCLTYSTEPGTGFLIRAQDLESLEAFQEEINRWRGVIIFHNWLYDCDPVRLMGLSLPRKLIRDTMVIAFHLGNIPQGLKALAYRELGMEMEDFDDLVTPYSREHVLEYYRQCLAEDWGRPPEQLKRNDKTGGWKSYKPQGFNAKLKRFFGDFAKNPTKDPFEMWGNWEEMHEQIQSQMGPWPGKCITHAPFDAVRRYAIRDADATLRLYPVLRKMQKQMRLRPQEFWSDAT